MRYYTTVEQSKHLLELGFDPDTADMVYIKFCTSDNPTMRFEEPPIAMGDMKVSEVPESSEYKLPCWSLGALIDLMPSTINVNSEELDFELLKNESKYFSCYSGNGIFRSKNGDTAIEAAFKMVVWLFENWYLKKEE